MTTDLVRSILPLIELFGNYNIPYAIGESVASSSLGMARATIGTDLVADLRHEHVKSLIDRLGTSYYLDEGTIRDAIDHSSCFIGQRIPFQVGGHAWCSRSTGKSAAGSLASVASTE